MSLTKRELNIIACCKVLLDDRYQDDKNKNCYPYKTNEELRKNYVNKIVDLVYKKIKS